jgi:hypothetical protein
VTSAPRSAVASALVAVALTLIVTAATFALLATLPRLSSTEELAVRAARVAAARDSASTVIHTPRGRRRARCRKLPERRELVLPGTGRPFLLVRGLPTTLGGEPLPRSLLAEAYLSGCPRLLAQSVGRRLLRSRPVYAGATRFRGRPAHELIATAATTNVRLFVELETLEPLGVRFGDSAVARFVR